MRCWRAQKYSMPDPDLVRLRHLLDAAREALQFVEGRSRQDLGTDRMLNLSLVRLLEIIFEGTAPWPELCFAIAG